MTSATAPIPSHRCEFPDRSKFHPCGQLRAELLAELASYEAEGPFCSICDGSGHGYPGGPPCPLEETGYWEARAQEDYEAAAGVIPFDVAFAAATA
jgi:hypothetical protein